MSRTISELAIEALDVQDACNFIAVVNGMQRAIADLRSHGFQGSGLTNHPIALLWVDCQLARRPGSR